MNLLNGFSNRNAIKKGLYMESFGNGNETLVFLPGLGGTTRYWASRLDSLKDDYRIVLVDLLGFGKSPMPMTEYSVNRHIDYIHEVLSDIESFSMIGHSLGSLLTVAYASKYTKQVKNIALLSMPYFESQESAYEYMRNGPIKGGFLYTNRFLAMLTCVFSRRVFGWTIPLFANDIPNEVLEDLVKHNMFSSISSLWEVVYRYDANEDLKNLPENIGVLFIHGDKDDTAPIENVQKLVYKQCNWHLQILPDHDHHPFLHDPERCLGLINTFLLTKESQRINIQ